MHAFVTSKLDTCNSLLYGLPKSQLSRLQRIQNTAARIVTRSRREDHITPVLMNLHWLPVEQRIEYKILLLTFKALHGLAPGYLQQLIKQYVPRRELRSMDKMTLYNPTANLKSYGYRSFQKAAPTLWNRLPQNITVSTLSSFKQS